MIRNSLIFLKMWVIGGIDIINVLVPVFLRCLDLLVIEVVVDIIMMSIGKKRSRSGCEWSTDEEETINEGSCGMVRSFSFFLIRKQDKNNFYTVKSNLMKPRIYLTKFLSHEDIAKFT